MLVLLGLVAVVLAVVGGLVVGTGCGVAVWMDDGLMRTGRAVDVLVDRRPDHVVLRRQVAPPRRHGDYVVMGSGLLGLAAVMVLGVLLVLLA